jgi:hypothetical protein
VLRASRGYAAGCRALTAVAEGLWRADNHYEGGDLTIWALQRFALVFGRPGELRAARRDEINSCVAHWRILAENAR